MFQFHIDRNSISSHYCFRNILSLILKQDFNLTHTKRLNNLALQPVTHCVLLQVEACSGVN